MFKLVQLMASAGKSSYIARIGYGDFVFSFFSTISYHFEGEGNWGRKFPRLLLDLCDHGLVLNQHLDELESELKIIYDKLKKLTVSEAIYDLEDLGKSIPKDLLPGDEEKVENLAQLWVTPRGNQIYFNIFSEMILTAKHCGGALALIYAPESFDKDILIKPKNKGRKYWLNI